MTTAVSVAPEAGINSIPQTMDRVATLVICSSGRSSAMVPLTATTAAKNTVESAARGARACDRSSATVNLTATLATKNNVQSAIRGARASRRRQRLDRGGHRLICGQMRRCPADGGDRPGPGHRYLRTGVGRPGRVRGVRALSALRETE